MTPIFFDKFSYPQKPDIFPDWLEDDSEDDFE